MDMEDREVMLDLDIVVREVGEVMLDLDREDRAVMLDLDKGVRAVMLDLVALEVKIVRLQKRRH